LAELGLSMSNMTSNLGTTLNTSLNNIGSTLFSGSAQIDNIGRILRRPQQKQQCGSGSWGKNFTFVEKLDLDPDNVFFFLKRRIPLKNHRVPRYRYKLMGIGPLDFNQ
jgi:hypothetical protein